MCHRAKEKSEREIALEVAVHQNVDMIRKYFDDDERRQRLSRQARQKVEEEFELETVARHYRNLYEEILGHGS